MSEITHLKPPVNASHFEYKELKQGEFWRHVPAYREVDEATFLDHLWQQKHAVKTPQELLATIKDLCSGDFFADAEAGFEKAPMAVRVSPYALALIDWNDPVNDPIRRQFVPLASALLPDHPRLTLDSLHEQADSPVPGLVHRYVDKALFLPLNTCPVYCRFCTRSYAIGPDTENVDKVALAKTPKQWEDAFQYISERPELEDIVISGGDAYQLPPKNIALIGNALLDIPHVRRMRFATKGPAIMPMKLLTDDPLARRAHVGRQPRPHDGQGRRPPHALQRTRRDHVDHGKSDGALFERGIFTRNQSVLIRGVNDTPERMALLVKRLEYVNVHPYYVYMHDMVKGVEELRTTIQTSIDIEKFVRGETAGFNTPLFICDAPGGGGKRDIHSFDYYDRENGICVYTAPAVKKNKAFVYFDPIDKLSPDAQARWAVKEIADQMIREALRRAGDAADELVLA